MAIVVTHYFFLLVPPGTTPRDSGIRWTLRLVYSYLKWCVAPLGYVYGNPYTYFRRRVAQKDVPPCFADGCLLRCERECAIYYTTSSSSSPVIARPRSSGVSHKTLSCFKNAPPLK